MQLRFLAGTSLLAIGLLTMALWSAGIGTPEEPPTLPAVTDAGVLPAGIVPAVQLAAQPDPTRPVYPYSIVPGGITSVEELKQAMNSDSVVAAHFANFDLNKTRVETLKAPRLAHVSYRLGNEVFWTKRQLLIKAGERVLTDGKNVARTRCANQVATQPAAVSPLEPTAATMDTPVGGLKAESIPPAGILQPRPFGFQLPPLGTPASTPDATTGPRAFPSATPGPGGAGPRSGPSSGGVVTATPKPLPGGSAGPDSGVPADLGGGSGNPPTTPSAPQGPPSGGPNPPGGPQGPPNGAPNPPPGLQRPPANGLTPLGAPPDPFGNPPSLGGPEGPPTTPPGTPGNPFPPPNTPLVSDNPLAAPDPGTPDNPLTPRTDDPPTTGTPPGTDTPPDPHTPAQVPEPAMIILTATGLAAAARRLKARTRKGPDSV
jgi:hypothetical protein